MERLGTERNGSGGITVDSLLSPLEFLYSNSFLSIAYDFHQILEYGSD